MAECLVTREAIQRDVLEARVRSVGRGGLTTFEGLVRRSGEDGPVVAIEYSGYEEMIASEGARILDEAQREWPMGRASFIHRLGRVPAGEASVVVTASAPHRDQAFAMCRFVIEHLKARLPVWKQEFFDDGTSSWRDNATSLPGSP